MWDQKEEIKPPEWHDTYKGFTLWNVTDEDNITSARRGPPPIKKTSKMIKESEEKLRKIIQRHIVEKGPDDFGKSTLVLTNLEMIQRHKLNKARILAESKIKPPKMKTTIFDNYKN